MKSFKINNVVRLGSFILIAILLICIVGVAANGWQADNDINGTVNGGHESFGTNENQKPNDTDDETNTTNKDNDITDPPKYVSTATGLEISEEKFNSPTIGVVFNPLEQLYGISSSELSIEFPTENGISRILSYTTDNSNLWKLGSLSATRGYISAMCNFYGGIVVSTHNDDIIKYNDQLAVNTELNIFYIITFLI